MLTNAICDRRFIGAVIAKTQYIPSLFGIHSTMNTMELLFIKHGRIVLIHFNSFDITAKSVTGAAVVFRRDRVYTRVGISSYA